MNTTTPACAFRLVTASATKKLAAGQKKDPKNKTESAKLPENQKGMFRKITVRDVKNAVLVLLLLILFNTLQILSAYNTRVFGDLNFYDISAHYIIFLYSLVSLFCCLTAWRLINKIQVPLLQKLFLLFLLAQLLFGLVSSVVFILIRASIGLSTPLAWLPYNFLFASTMCHFQIMGACIAWLYFNESRKLKDALEKADQEKKVLRARVLKNNLEPHFLFNNLSALSGLLQQNRDAADQFLDSLSEVYRYFLRHNESDKVSLKEELNFAMHYIRLMQVRFGGAYDFEIATDDDSGMVLPFAIQALKIRIRRQGYSLIIQNMLRPQGTATSHKTGLSNLDERYALISGKRIKIVHDSGYFTVELPLL
jgi:sensor histidine kinase YesM